MKLKAGRYAVRVEAPFFAFTDSLKARVEKVYAWVKANGGKVEEHSPTPPSSVRIQFSIPKAARWNLEFSTPKRSKKLSPAVPWSQVNPSRPNPDVVDKGADFIKDAAPQIGLLVLLILLASRSNK